MTFVFTFFIIIRRRAIIECALVVCLFDDLFQNMPFTVVIRYNTIGGVHKYESCYKPIVLYEMARFYLVLLDTI